MRFNTSLIEYRLQEIKKSEQDIAILMIDTLISASIRDKTLSFFQI